MIIKKILNTSVVLVEDQAGEMIVLGKGIGFGKKVGQSLDRHDSDQVFLPTQSSQARHLLELVNSIPGSYFDLSAAVIDYARVKLNYTFPPLLYFSLTDHLHFALERHEKGMVITNKIYWEVKNYYPEEFSVGQYALEKIRTTFHSSLPEEEAANIAFHFINVKPEYAQVDLRESAKLITNIINLIRYSLEIDIGDSSIHYQRLVTHIRFFVERFLSDQLIQEGDQSLFDQIEILFPKAMAVAKKVKGYIHNTYQIEIPDHELTYIAIHVNRLMIDKTR